MQRLSGHLTGEKMIQISFMKGIQSSLCLFANELRKAKALLPFLPLSLYEVLPTSCLMSLDR